MSFGPACNTRCRLIQSVAAMASTSPFLVYAEGSPVCKRLIALSYVNYNCTEKMVFDIFLNGHGGGLAPAYGVENSVMLFTQFQISGPQTLTWRLGGLCGMPGNGDTITAKNRLFIREEDIPNDKVHAPHIASHIYPDHTTELTFAIGTPQPMLRGVAILKEHAV